MDKPDRWTACRSGFRCAIRIDLSVPRGSRSNGSILQAPALLVTWRSVCAARLPRGTQPRCRLAVAQWPFVKPRRNAPTCGNRIGDTPADRLKARTLRYGHPAVADNRPADNFRSRLWR